MKFINCVLIASFVYSAQKFSYADKVVSLTSDNFDQFLASYELVFVNFHAEWCRFSQQISPILEKSYQTILNEIKEPRKVLFAKVDCDQHSNLATRYQITKYPTLKFYLNAKMLKREYRGERNEKAIVDYVRDLLSDPITHIEFHDLTNFTSIVFEHRAVICYQQNQPNGLSKRYDMFRRVATDLRDYCHFYWVTNAPFLPENKEEMVAFKQPRTNEQSEYQNSFQNYDELSTWSIGLCIPVVREINFKNAEEIIEENLPLVILFHHIDDHESVDWFKLVVHYELIRETSNVNFVTADGALFQHPLEHLGKTQKDLPLIAIDSFKHMYLFPHFEDLKKGRILPRFIEDLKSGKLHREYHFGADSTTTAKEEDHLFGKPNDPSQQTPKSEHEINENEVKSDDDNVEVLKPVAESVFKKLAPSSNRYTLLRDEL